MKSLVRTVILNALIVMLGTTQYAFARKAVENIVIQPQILQHLPTNLDDLFDGLDDDDEGDVTEPTLTISSETRKNKLDNGSGPEATNIGAWRTAVVPYEYSITYPRDYGCNKNARIVFQTLTVEFPNGTTRFIEGYDLEDMITGKDSNSFYLDLSRNNQTSGKKLLKLELFVSLNARDQNNSCFEDEFSANTITDVVDLNTLTELRLLVNLDYDADEDPTTDHIRWVVGFKDPDGDFFGLSQKLWINCGAFITNEAFSNKMILPWIEPHDASEAFEFQLISSQAYSPLDLDDITGAQCYVNDASGNSSLINMLF